MSQIVVKAMANENKANIAQRALIEKLTMEFALDMNKISNPVKAELNPLVEKNQTNIKITGMLQETYKMLKDSSDTTTSYGQEKVRLNAVAKVDDNTTVNLRIGSPAARSDMFKDTTTMKYGDYSSNSFRVDRFNATSKIGVVNATVGRQALEVDPEDIIVDSDFFSFDGVGVQWNWQGLNVDVKRGRFAKGLDNSSKKGYWGFDDNPLTKSTDKYNVTTYKGNFSDVDVDSLLVSGENGNFNWDAGWSRF